MALSKDVAVQNHRGNAASSGASRKIRLFYQDGDMQNDRLRPVQLFGGHSQAAPRTPLESP